MGSTLYADRGPPFGPNLTATGAQLKRAEKGDAAPGRGGPHLVREPVVCLISALRSHDIGTQLPAEVWIPTISV